MNFTAKQFKANKGKAFYHASNGGTVTIAHDRYPEHRFELTSRPISPYQEDNDYCANVLNGLVKSHNDRASHE